ncbi:probable methyltransferase-like protein 25 isoform X1 [Impatiens glandulifera]|uniref:probable methyltransferase-like protein 25 isoform X1 n=1 Tax=Impatiens glandulifera TaxID=253017 RepID=UPI001FB05446|nr:probable methyltransferase-like protein 25 isoform X1 [Impatiens glandulifera]
MASYNLEFSCDTAENTLAWIHSIIDFLDSYRFFLEAHVVNFFKDRLWENVDKEWIDCLRNESSENLVQIPSGVVQEYWPPSLKKFVLTSRSLAIRREQANLSKVLPDMHLASLNQVLTQGMNPKKKHEVEVLAGVVSCIAKGVGASTVVDVGAGQGYLAQVLSFEYQLPVIAIDASSHHARVTDARAERIKKHYFSKLRKTGSGSHFNIPKTVTCQILSTETLKALSRSSLQKDLADLELVEESAETESSLLLAGLHACGDLSVTMLRSFLDCKEIRAVVSIGCCYNLLSEEGSESADFQCGFPMSKGVKSTKFSLGKSSRDLACQSAERWKGLGIDASLHNFNLHALRAAFQMVLFHYYPETLEKSPIVGRQGKALLRQQHRKEESTDSMNFVDHNILKRGNIAKANGTGEYHIEGNADENHFSDPVLLASASIKSGSMAGKTSGAFSNGSSNQISINEDTKKYLLFEEFSVSALSRLGFSHLKEVDFSQIWKETEPFAVSCLILCLFILS